VVASPAEHEIHRSMTKAASGQEGRLLSFWRETLMGSSQLAFQETEFDAPLAPALDVLVARAEARAILWGNHAMELQEAVDQLWEWADAQGLVKSVGADTVQAILADAFEPWQDRSC